MNNRVVITGMGAVTPLGNTVDEFWDGLKAGKNGIASITKFDASETGITVAGELKDFDATKYMQRKISKRMDEFSRYGVAAAVQALEESGIDREKKDMNRFGVIVGSGIGGLNAMQDQIIKMNTKRFMSVFSRSMPLSSNA